MLLDLFALNDASLFRSRTFAGDFVVDSFTRRYVSVSLMLTQSPRNTARLANVLDLAVFINEAVHTRYVRRRRARVSERVIPTWTPTPKWTCSLIGRTLSCVTRWRAT